MLKRVTPTSPRDARLAATLRRTQTVPQDSISMLPAASAVLRLSSLLSPRATSPFIAALASKREEDPSNQVNSFKTPYSPDERAGLVVFLAVSGQWTVDSGQKVADDNLIGIFAIFCAVIYP